MKTQKIVSFIIYLIAAAILGSVALYRMMLGVWGVSVSPFNYIAILASAVLLFGAILCLINFRKGRIICAIALAALGPFYISAIVSLVPEYNAAVSPIIYFIFLVYFIALAFALFYPTRWKFSFPFYLAVFLIAAVLVRTTYTHRMAIGEYARPSFASFIWKPSDSTLQIVEDDNNWISADTKSLLEKNGIRGQLKWEGATGYRTNENRVIVLAQRQIVSPKQIFYPRSGTIIYAFDGTNWIMLPHDAPVYSSFATLKPSGSQTMLERDVLGGTEGTSAFLWK